jgi:hypothetical protein
MAHASHTVHVRLAWWVHPYIATLCMVSTLTGWQPNPDRLGRVLARGLHVSTR